MLLGVGSDIVVVMGSSVSAAASPPRHILVGVGPNIVIMGCSVAAATLVRASATREVDASMLQPVRRSRHSVEVWGRMTSLAPHTFERISTGCLNLHDSPSL